VARFGGDEFVVVLEDVTDASEALKVAERFHERLRVPFDVDGEHQMYTSASIGIAIAPTDGNDPDQLLKNADLALYSAKAQGRDRVVASCGRPVGLAV